VIFTSDNGACRPGSNLPLRGGKATIFEGGMRVPCVVRWPGKVPAGVTCDEITATIDLLPTFARLAGAALPKATIDGKDITDIFLGKPGATTPHEAYYYYFMSQLQAVRSGKWKLYLPLKVKIGKWMGTPQGSCQAELYDLSTDIAETTNVIADHSAVVKRLTALADIARKDIGDYKSKGAGQRKPGFVKDPKLLVYEEK